jgi:hypothetical protein
MPLLGVDFIIQNLISTSRFVTGTIVQILLDEAQNFLLFIII